ncbi:MAG: FHA domain-containing protein [Hyphomicrobiaceae bacterium]
MTQITEQSASPEPRAVTPAAVPPPVVSAKPAPQPARSHVEVEPPAPAEDPISAPPRTQLVRGRLTVKRTDFHQDPVVGWLVVVGGPGLGAFRPIYEGNNTIGRAPTQRIPINFGDVAISSEEQAYLRYDSMDRKFLLVPNLAKTNIIAVNDKKPTSAVELSAMDLITIGRTQLAFVPFCGVEFDWSELNDLKG